MRIAPSPVIALNRAMAIAEVEGPSAGLEALDALEGVERLRGYPFLAAARGELERRAGRLDLAREHFRTATAMARNDAERGFLSRRITSCTN